MRIMITRILLAIIPMMSFAVIGLAQGPCGLTFSANITNETCPGFFDGGIDITILTSGGTLSYVWSTGATTQDINSITSGTYYVTVDDGACTVLDTFVVTDDHGMTVSLGNDTTLCQITNYLMVPQTVGATFYYWQNNTTTPTHLANGPGIYHVYVQNSFGCYAADTVELFQFPVVQSSITTTQPGCGASAGILDLTASAGAPPFTYLWSNGSQNEDISNLASGTYTVTVTDTNGCTAVTNGIVLPSPDFSGFVTELSLVCASDSLHFNANTYGFMGDGNNDYFELPDTTGSRPGSQYTLEAWIIPTAASGPPQGIVEKRLLSNDGVALTYDPTARHVIARQQNGPFFTLLTSNAILPLGVWTHITFVVDGVKSSLYINGVLDQQAAITTGTNPVVGTPWTIGGGPNRLSFDGLIDEVRFWNVALTTAQIDEMSDRTIPFGQADLGMYVNFNEPAGTSTAYDHSIYNVQGYFVNADSETVWQSSNPLGLHFLWNFGDNTVNNSQAAIHIYQPGTELTANVTLEVTSNGGCMSADTVVIPVHTPTSPFVQQSADGPFCLGDSVFLFATGGYNNYLWSNGSLNDSIVAIGTGWYTLVAEDGIGCVHNDSLRLIFYPNSTPVPVLSPADTSYICQGDTLILDVGSGYAVYQWSNGATTQTVAVADSGRFFVTVYNGFGCARMSDTSTVLVLPTPVATITQQNDTLFASPGVSFQWYQNGQLISGAITNAYVPLVSGSYTVVVGQVGGCDAVSGPFSFLVAVEELELDGSWTVYPNPTEGDAKLRLDLNKGLSLQARLVDLQGRVIWTQFIQAGTGISEWELPTASLPAGMYLLQMQGRDRQWTRQLVKF